MDTAITAINNTTDAITMPGLTLKEPISLSRKSLFNALLFDVNTVIIDVMGGTSKPKAINIKLKLLPFSKRLTITAVNQNAHVPANIIK